MAVRDFTDSKGVRWHVWSTTPAADSPLVRYYPGGWLTFDSGGATLRRLSPAPKGWEACSEERMELMCRAAEEVPRHTGEIRKFERPTEEELPSVRPLPSDDPGPKSDERPDA